MKRVLLGAALFAALIRIAGACGIEWSVPTNHFDGVNEWGQVSYWNKIGEIDCGEELKLPLIIGFKSTERNSPILGQGWILPLLESSVVQIDDKKFLLTQPDGILRRFSRKKPTDTVLTGQGNWVGDIKGDIVTLWASCGWKLTFTKGKLSSICTPKNRVLTVQYIDGVPSTLHEAGNVLLRVERDSPNGPVMGLSYNATRIGIEWGEKPRVQVLQDAKVLGGIDKSLRKVGFPGEQQATYEFAVDSKLNPTLKINDGTSSDRMIVWDAATGRILKDGQWTYSIQSGKNRWSNAAIGRSNGQNQTEFWHEDKRNGREIIRTLDGVETIRTWFTSGVLSGLDRSYDQFKENKQINCIRLQYDERGELLREIRNEVVTRERRFDSQGRITYELDPQKGVTQWDYEQTEGYQKAVAANSGAGRILDKNNVPIRSWNSDGITFGKEEIERLRTVVKTFNIR